MFHVKQSLLGGCNALAQLECSLPIRDRTNITRIVRDDSLAIAESLRNTHRTRNNGLKRLIREVRAHLALDLFGELRALIRHGEQHARNTQAGVEIHTNPFDGVPQLAEALQGVVFGLNRDHDLIRGDHDVEDHEAKRGRAVDEHDVDIGMLRNILAQGLTQSILTALDIDELDLGTREVDRGRAHDNTVDVGARLHNIGDAGATDNDVVG